MAEAAFRHTVKESGYAESFTRIDSCGTAGYHIGARPDSRMSLSLFGRKHQHQIRGVCVYGLRLIAWRFE